MSTVTTWMNGAVMTLDANDPRLAEQEAERVLCRYVANMRRLPQLHARQEYIANVERREGADARARLEVAVAADWEARKTPNVEVSR